MSSSSSIELGEVMATTAGSVDPSRFLDETFDLYSIPAFDNGQPDIVTGAEIGSAKQVVAPGDVLLSKIVPHIRRAWVVGPRRGRRIIASGEWIVFRSERLHAPYFRHVLVGDLFHAQFMQTVSGVGGSLLRARPSYVAKISVPLPGLVEQRRIAQILDKADTLRAKRRAALAQLDTLTQSIFLDMFGDPAANPKGWPRKQVGDVAVVITGNTPSRAVPEYFGSAIEWIKSDNINTPHYYLTQAAEGLSERGRSVARVAPAGSILVTCIAGSPDCIGNAAMTDREVAFNQQINAVVPSEGDAHFIYGLLRVGKRLTQRASTAGMKGMVSKSRFESIPLIWPPKQLQERFADRVLAVGQALGQHGAALRCVDALFASLQHRAFRGEL